MRLTIEQIIKKLKDAGLKVTPQRLFILEAVYDLGNHPTAENIFDHIRTAHPGISNFEIKDISLQINGNFIKSK